MVERNYEWLICFSAYKFPSVPVPDTIKSRPHHRHNLQHTRNYSHNFILSTIARHLTMNYEKYIIEILKEIHIKWTDQLTSVRLKIDATASAVRIWTNCNQHTLNMNNSQSLWLQKISWFGIQTIPLRRRRKKNQHKPTTSISCTSCEGSTSEKTPKGGEQCAYPINFYVAISFMIV